MIIAVSWSAASACSRRAREPSDAPSSTARAAGRARPRPAREGDAPRRPDRRDHSADVVGRGVLLDERGDLRQATRGAGHPGDVGLLRDVPGEVDGVGLLEAQQVGRRHQPDGLVVGIEDRQVVDVPADHLQEHLEGEGVGGSGDRFGGHDVGDGSGRVDVDGEHAGAQVTVGEDAGQAAVAGTSRADTRSVDIRRAASRTLGCGHRRRSGRAR